MSGPAGHDLWFESDAGGGRDAPGTLGPLAAAAGLAGFALADRGTTAGLAAAAAGAAAAGVGFLPGVTLDAEAAGLPVAVFGYGVDPDAEPLRAALAEAGEAQRLRFAAVRAALEAAGIRLPADRPPDAAALVAAGFAPSRHAATRRYLGPGGVAHVAADRPPAAEVSAAVRGAGGRAFLRPGPELAADAEGLEHAVARLAASDMAGLVATTRAEHTAWSAVAGRLGLCVVGGSGYRGAGRGPEPGAATTDAPLWHALTR
ncbi:hypothetical protein [Phycisphaera mikurensis]|uniref:Uncharacterized protein n=1 Tax=Phycisphaera mikurensis (strain NBRC 102666 / KCTC 22515 / FYK2301M01) TaxID=1142394 RepID=I0IB91_PHYMF|nr:hypothetical protein [Phycisphaera mikurensis]MBB6443027.1 hypothetical protein [Phycisphaera mikurensis]BAM02529.1 hypothetical protein PSMK_03700 [Phycisphaera mikurensis NBRC 102666]